MKVYWIEKHVQAHKDENQIYINFRIASMYPLGLYAKQHHVFVCDYMI